ncbi:hypothetical protein [Chengkuizengella sediminis]|uniref:hypothetical protein n=1 Tax=Chengkuizengella sediminis TaxID=1885917 RepID=UPI001389BF8A|nr:hypothetical protein [Chengkuizengella sediminis]NDI35369.1 hypothetical protein [Chengkuizengella sediminis]
MKKKIYYQSKKSVYFFLFGFLIISIIILFSATVWWEYILAFSLLFIFILMTYIFLKKAQKIELNEDYFIYYDNRFKEPTMKWRWEEITQFIEIKSRKEEIQLIRNNDVKSRIVLFNFLWGKDLFNEIEQRAINAKFTYL